MIIAVFIFITFGSFIWFIATWNADVEEPISSLTAPLERVTL
jgi:hypothetical protein